MQISRYGIVLQTMEQKDLEKVRIWRNSNHVRLNMKYQEIISVEMQEKWFADLDKKTNYYFIINKDEKQVGVVNLKNINYGLLQAEAGIFIGEEEHLNTLTPISATISMMEFAFDVLKLKILKAQIASSNVKAILFNESIGYRKKLKNLDNNFQYYYTTEYLFKQAIKNIQSTLDKMK